MSLAIRGSAHVHPLPATTPATAAPAAPAHSHGHGHAEPARRRAPRLGHRHARAREHAGAHRLEQRSPERVLSGHSMLRAGSSGPEVKMLKQQLRAAGFDSGAGDRFDARTEDAVRRYQQAKGLQVDGIVGQQTWGALYGFKVPPGGELLKGGGGPRGSGRDAPPPELGPGRSVAGYVNGQRQDIQVVSVGNGQYLRTDAAAAWKKMQAAARADGIDLSATSGFRTNEQQQALYQKYLNGTGNLAARPGHSNHQGGISMDIGGVNGYGTAAYRWLQNNAGRFGFVNDVRGEYWHWTYKR